MSRSTPMFSSQGGVVSMFNRQGGVVTLSPSPTRLLWGDPVRNISTKQSSLPGVRQTFLPAFNTAESNSAVILRIKVLIYSLACKGKQIENRGT